MKLLDYLFLLFCGSSILFYTVDAPICSPLNSEWGFTLVHILTLAYYLLSFWWLPFRNVWGSVLLGVDEHFPGEQWCWTTFPVCVDCVYVFSKNFCIQSLCSFFSWIIWSFWCWFMWILCVFWIWIPDQIYCLQISSFIQ